MSSAMSYGLEQFHCWNIPVGEIVGLLSRAIGGQSIALRVSRSQLAGPIGRPWSRSPPSWSASVLLSARHVEDDLAQLAAGFKPCVRRFHFLHPEHRLDGDTNPPRREQWQDLARDEARGDRLLLERTGPERGAVNAGPATHEPA